LENFNKYLGIVWVAIRSSIEKKLKIKSLIWPRLEKSKNQG
jgi:hypothetical protein